MLKSKLTLYTIGGALAIGLIFGLLAFRGDKGKKFEKIKIDKTKIPQDWKPDLLAKQLYDEMDGPNWSNDDTKIVLEQMNQLNDEQFKSVYNEFNKKYGNETWTEKGSLRDWIQDEYGLAGSKIGYAVLDRMNRLKLT